MISRNLQAASWKALCCRAGAAGFALLTAWCLSACLCWGQAAPGGSKEMREYTAADGSKVKIPKQPRLKRFRVQEILRSGKVPAAEEAAFEEYFMYVIAEFTFESNRARLTELRDQLKRYYLQEVGKDASGAELHARLTQLMLTQFLALARDEEYAAPVRYNAILVVGDLNLREGSPPQREDYVPLPQALQPLMEIATQGQHPYYLRVGALVGIERHLRSRDGIAAEARRDLVQNLTTMLQDASGGSAGSIWLRRRAARCLSLLAMKHPEAMGPSVGAMLGDVVSDDKADLALRCDAAYALGVLQDRAIPADTVHKSLQGIGALAVKVIADASRQTHASVPSAGDVPGGDSQGPSGQQAAADEGGAAAASKNAPAQEGQDPADAQDAEGAGGEQADKEEQPNESDDPFAPDAEGGDQKKPAKKAASGRSSASAEDATTVEVRKVVSRTLSYRLGQLRLAIEGVPTTDGTAVARGLAAVAAAQAKQAATQLAAKLKETEELAAKTARLSQEEFLQQLAAKSRELEQWLKGNAAGQPAAAAGAVAPPKNAPATAAR